VPAEVARWLRPRRIAARPPGDRRLPRRESCVNSALYRRAGRRRTGGIVRAVKLALAGAIALVVLAAIFLLFPLYGPGRATAVAPRGAAVRVYVDGALAGDVAPR